MTVMATRVVIIASASAALQAGLFLVPHTSAQAAAKADRSVYPRTFLSNTMLETWVGETQDAIGVKKGNLVFEKENRGTPVNARSDQAVADGEHYYVVKCKSVKSYCSIGIVEASNFKQGWANRGLFFNGNLSNGTSLIRSQWGAFIRTGDTIGVLVDLTNPERVMVTYYQNGRCLGPSFDAARRREAPYFLAISSEGLGDTFAVSRGIPPEGRKWEPLTKRDNVEGRYTLDQLFVGPELGAYPLERIMGKRKVVMDVRATGSRRYELSLRVCNVIRFSAVSTPDETLFPFDGFKISSESATAMTCGNQDMNQLEDLLREELVQVYKWLRQTRDNGQSLLITGPTCELAFTEIPEEADGPVLIEFQ